MRIQVEIDLNKPLVVGFLHNEMEVNETEWIQLRYERLSSYWCYCGLMDHLIIECRETKPALFFLNNGSKFLLYGDWVQEKYKIEAPVVGKFER